LKGLVPTKDSSALQENGESPLQSGKPSFTSYLTNGLGLRPKPDPRHQDDGVNENAHHDKKPPTNYEVLFNNSFFFFFVLI
jgi:hypothetical protein